MVKTSLGMGKQEATTCARRVEVTTFAASCLVGCPGQLEKNKE